ncbi:MAG: zinc metallopeptidase [Thermoleophilia bacterium]|nr:zinc metallopeptidase [Thermoleophilia bacterium]
MYSGFFYWDLILLVPAVVLGIYAQYKVKSAFNRYSQIPSARGLTGAQGARMVLDSAGLANVGIEVGGSTLSDHYDPRTRTLSLSPEVGNSNSLAALGVAAHEAGHAIQHAQGYAAFKLRSAMVPVANIGTNLGLILFIVGIVIASYSGNSLLMNIGIVLYAAAVLFTLVTLPVEFNASRRAMAELQNRSILVADELTGARKVLSAAALTYVAAALSAILTLLRLILISRRD